VAPTLFPPGSQRAVVASDALAFLVFAAIGQLSHHGDVTAAGLARDAGPLLAGWFAVALVARTYRRPGRRTLLAAWALGVPAGVLLRALLLGRSLDHHEAAFLGTTLAFGAAFVLAGRALVGLVATRGALHGRR